MTRTVDAVDLSVLTTTSDDFTERDGTLPLLVAALRRQSLPAGTEPELVIVDDGDEPETRAYVEELAATGGGPDSGPEFDVVHAAADLGGNYSAALNRAIDRASGDLLVFVDVDTLPLGADAVRRALEYWEPGRLLCGARQHWTPPNWERSRLLEAIRNWDRSRIREWAHLPTNAVDRATGRRSLQEYTFPSNFGVISAADVGRVGGFDETVETWRDCDRDLLERLIAEGIEVVSLFDTTEVLHVNHPHRSRRGKADPGRERRAIDPTVDPVELLDPDGDGEGGGADDERASPPAGGRRVSIRAPGDLGAPRGAEPGLPTADRAATTGDGRYGAADVSVVVPTYDAFDARDGAIELLLRALERQRADGFEVVVVDDGSADRTRAFLDDYAAESPLDLTVVSMGENTGNRALTRNVGVEAADGDLLVFVDDDTVPLADDAIGRVLAAYEPGTFLCAAKRYWTGVEWDRAECQRLVETGRYEALRERSVFPRGINWRHGYRALFEYTFLANFGAVSREAFESVDGFDDELLSEYDHEDVDLMYRLYLEGYDFASLHDTLGVVHLNHPIRAGDADSREASVDRFRRRERRRGYGFKVNHLFGVYENDGDAILEELDAEAPHSYR